MIFGDGMDLVQAQLDVLRDELEDARGEISSLIGHLEAVREDLERYARHHMYKCTPKKR